MTLVPSGVRWGEQLSRRECIRLSPPKRTASVKGLLPEAANRRVQALRESSNNFWEQSAQEGSLTGALRKRALASFPAVANHGSAPLRFVWHLNLWLVGLFLPSWSDAKRGEGSCIVVAICDVSL